MGEGTECNSWWKLERAFWGMENVERAICEQSIFFQRTSSEDVYKLRRYYTRKRALHSRLGYGKHYKSRKKKTKMPNSTMLDHFATQILDWAYLRFPEPSLHTFWLLGQRCIVNFSQGDSQRPYSPMYAHCPLLGWRYGFTAPESATLLKLGRTESGQCLDGSLPRNPLYRAEIHHGRQNIHVIK